MECFSYNVIPKFLSEPISFLLEDEEIKRAVKNTVTQSCCLQPNPGNTDTEGRATESIRINGVSVLSGLNLSGKCEALFPQGQSRQTGRNNELSY